MKLSTFISQRDYQTFAGPDWPSYHDFVAGQQANHSHIQQEIDQFVVMMRQSHEALIKSGDELAQGNQQRQKQVFYNKKYFSASPCRVPWETLGVNSNGDVYICSSPSWIPLFVGNILQTTDIYQVLNSEIAQSIRQEILEGRYFYCNNRICNYFSDVDPTQYASEPVVDDRPLTVETRADTLVNQIPKNLIFDFDYTCNFKCPSCRTEVINNNKHHIIRPINDRIVQVIREQIIDRVQNQPILIRWCGGEPFISDVYNELLDYITAQNKPNIRHIIQTNGSYLQKKANKIRALLPSVQELRISFDAACAETYAKTRVGGDWNLLLENVKWVKWQIQQLGADTKLSADFVVQRDNYNEIPAFVELCNQLGIPHINFQKMWNWGTWPQQQFDDNNIYNPDHPEYDQLVQKFQQAGRKIKF